MGSSRERPNFERQICARIRERRLEQGLTQAALARRAGLTPAQMQRYESGRTPITCAALLRIAETLGMPAVALLEGGETPVPLASAKASRARSETLDRVVTMAQEVLSALPLPMFITGKDGEILYVNEAGAQIAGREPKLGRDKWCVSWKLTDIDGSKLPHEECPLALTVRSGWRVRGAVTVMHRPDGSRQAFMPFPAPLRDAKGNVIGGFNALYPLRSQIESAMLSNGD